MKKLLLLIALLSGMAWAQENELRNDTLYLAKGGFLVEGQQLKLGKGSKDNGDFRNIQVSSSSLMRAYNTNGTNYGVQEANSLSNQYNDLEGKVIRFEKRGTKRTGKKYVVILGVGLPQRYEIDIDNAILSGEVILEGYNLPEAKSDESNSNISVADELLKLKELKDAGILTEEEFNAQKEKVLNK